MILAVVALLAAALPQTPPSFAAGVEAVYVDVFVTDRKGAVAGLTAADFTLRDDGVVRPVELVGLEGMPLTTLLALDTSDSVAGDKLEALKSAGRALVGQVRGDEIGLLTFGHEIRLLVPPTREAELVERKLAALGTGGATALYDAVYAATLLTPARGRSLLVLFTDGEDNTSWLDLAELRRVLESSNVILQVVGIVPEDRPGPVRLGIDTADKIPDEPPHVTRLRQLAECTGGRFWAARATARLEAAFVALMDAMKTRYVLRFEPVAGRRPGSHTLEVKLTRRGGTVHCRRSYFASQKQ